MDETNQHQYNEQAPAGPIKQLKAQHLEDWRILLDRLGSAKPPVPAHQIQVSVNACNAEIERLTRAIQTDIEQG